MFPPSLPPQSKVSPQISVLLPFLTLWPHPDPSPKGSASLAKGRPLLAKEPEEAIVFPITALMEPESQLVAEV